MNIYYTKHFRVSIMLTFMFANIMFNMCFSQEQTSQIESRNFKLLCIRNSDLKQEFDSLFLKIKECKYYKNEEDLFWKIFFYINKENNYIFEVTLTTSLSLTHEYIGLYKKNDLSVIISGDKELSDIFFEGTNKNKKLEWHKKPPMPEDFSLWIYEIYNNKFLLKKEYLLNCD